MRSFGIPVWKMRLLLQEIMSAGNIVRDSAAVMPEEWLTPNGQSWLNLQHSQGISPEQFAGMEITRYIFPVKNGAKPNLYAELLLCENALAGAVVYDTETQLMRPVR